MWVIYSFYKKFPLKQFYTFFYIQYRYTYTVKQDILFKILIYRHTYAVQFTVNKVPNIIVFTGCNLLGLHVKNCVRLLNHFIFYGGFIKNKNILLKKKQLTDSWPTTH